MKKRLAALVCAAVFACALPALAWAEGPTEPNADGGAAPVAQPATDQAAAPEQGAGGSAIEAQHRDTKGQISVLSGDTTSSQFSMILSTDWVDDNLRYAETYNVIVKQGTKKIDFHVVMNENYADSNKLEVHVRPDSTSAGIAKTFVVTRPADQSYFSFSSDIFNIGDQEGDNTYDADFVMALVPSKVDLGDTPVSDTASGADTGATSPKTGMDAGAVAGATLVLLAGAGAVCFALRRRLSK